MTFLFIALLPLLQDDPFDRLSDDDPTVRRKAADEIVAKGKDLLPKVRERQASASDPDLKTLLQEIATRIVVADLERTVLGNIEKLKGTSWYSMAASKDETAALKVSIEPTDKEVVVTMEPLGAPMQESIVVTCKKNWLLRPIHLKARRDVKFENGKMIRNDREIGDAPERFCLVPEFWVTLLPFEPGLEVKLVASPLAQMVDVRDVKDFTSDPMRYEGREAVEGQEAHRFTYKGSMENRGFKASYWVSAERQLIKALYELTYGEEKREFTLLRIDEKTAKEMAPTLLMKMNERNASGTLKQFGSVQVTFKVSDSDQNSVNDYWVADVSGLYRIQPGGNAIRMCEKAAAEADAEPLPAGEKKFAKKEDTVDLGPALGDKPNPKSGYWFRVMKNYESNGKSVPYDEGNGRCVDRFGVCAYPAEFNKTGRRTFILSEGGTLYWKEMDGKPADTFPDDPVKDGWKKME
jgi:hypothetical protein